jgi:lysozyme family protein
VTASNFPAALAFTLSQEGGFSDDAGDPGGATMNGITLATYRWYNNNPDLQAGDLQAMPETERNEIYREMFWGMVHADDLPPGIDLFTFDFAVNSGPGTAAKALQAALGVTADGAIGPITLAACQAADASDVIGKLRQARLIWCEQLPGWATFGRGWAARIQACATAALALVAA